MDELKEKGYLTMESKTLGVRRVGEQMLLDFEQINQKELLSKVTCPVLIIHGDGDEEEWELLERSKRGMKILSPESKLTIIKGAKHGFRDQYDEVIRLTCDWISEQLCI
jgi:pimeloyl-ACP methyl ester carboxylesterase